MNKPNVIFCCVALVALAMVAALISEELLDDLNNYRKGKSVTATVVKGGAPAGKLYPVEVAFEGHTATLRLAQQKSPGMTMEIIYLPEKPSVIFAGSRSALLRAVAPMVFVYCVLFFLGSVFVWVLVKSFTAAGSRRQAGISPRN